MRTDADPGLTAIDDRRLSADRGQRNVNSVHNAFVRLVAHRFGDPLGYTNGFHSQMTHHVPVSADDSQDPLSRMRVFQLASALVPNSFADAARLRDEPITEVIAGQLYAAVCSIEANISEGYSRSSGKDRARIFEYALGSVRESLSWYKSSQPILGVETTKDRRDRLEEMRRLLLAIIPRERGRKMK